jgi:hypothetical protein
MNTKIQSIIQNFVAELTEALQEASHEALSIALGGGANTVGNGRRMKTGPAARAAAPGAAGKGGKRTRRSQDDVQAQLSLVVGFLKKAKEPSGAEVIGKALGLTTVELSAPIKLGLSDKTLKKTGNLRGTRYSLK